MLGRLLMLGILLLVMIYRHTRSLFFFRFSIPILYFSLTLTFSLSHLISYLMFKFSFPTFLPYIPNSSCINFYLICCFRISAFTDSSHYEYLSYSPFLACSLLMPISFSVIFLFFIKEASSLFFSLYVIPAFSFFFFYLIMPIFSSMISLSIFYPLTPGTSVYTRSENYLYSDDRWMRNVTIQDILEGLVLVRGGVSVNKEGSFPLLLFGGYPLLWIKCYTCMKKNAVIT